MNVPPLHVWVLCSVKGGVGKSTLAVGLSQVLSATGGRPLVVDGDLTGTSLADGLDLCAPRSMRTAAGALDLSAPPTGAWMSRGETLAARDARGLATDGEAPPPPFFNDVLGYRGAYPEQECFIASAVWRSDPDDGVAYLPSSSLPRDVGQALAWLPVTEPLGPWTRRFAWILASVAEQMPETTHVVIDLSPGLFRFATEVLSLCAHIHGHRPLPTGFPSLDSGQRLDVRAFLVTGADRSDLFAAMEAFVALRQQLPTVVPVVNRRTEAPELVRERLRRRFEHTGFAGLRLEDSLVWVDEHATMARLFKQGRLDLTPDASADLAALIHGRVQ